MNFTRDTTGVLLSQLFLIASNVVVTRILGPDNKGVYYMIFQVVIILSVVSNLGIGIATVYFLGKKRAEPSAILSNSLWFALTVGSVLAAAFVAWTRWGPLPAFIADHIGLYLTAVWVLPVFTLSVYLSYFLWGMQRIGLYNIIFTAKSLALLAAALVFVWWLDWGVLGGIACFYSAEAVFCVIALISLSRRTPIRFGINRKLLGRSISFGLRGQLGNITQYFNYRLDTFFVVYFWGHGAVGLYSIAVALAEKLWLIPDSMAKVLFPKSAHSEAEELNVFTPRLARLVVAFSLCGSLGLLLLGRWVLLLLFGPVWLAAYPALVGLLAGIVCLSLSKILASDLSGRGHPEYSTYAAAISLVASIVLDLVLIPRWGIVGAAVASSVAYALASATVLVLFIRTSGLRLGDLLILRISDLRFIRRHAGSILRRTDGTP